MSSETLTIYHNPSCSKSRETLDILNQHNANPEIIEYLDNPPTKNDISNMVKMLGVAPAELLRTTEAAYINAGYNTELMSDEEIIEAIVQHPSLLQRPIIIYGDKAVIGRPPIKVLDIIPSKQA